MRRDDAGFTLIELLISAAVLALISVYLTGMLTQQNRAYAVVDQVTETQSNMRAVSALMEREIRTTAFMAPEGAAACGVDNTARSDVLYVTDSDAYENSNSVKSYALGAEVVSGWTTDTLRLATLSPDGVAQYDIDADGVVDSDYKPGAGVIVMDKNNPERGTACGMIRTGGVAEVSRSITLDWEAGASTLANVGLNRPEPFLVAVPAHRYVIDADNQLFRDDLVLAEDVEDLQIAYFVDLDDDKDIDANEFLGAAGEPVYSANGTNHEDLREIRFNFVMRSRRPEENLTGATFQALENRQAIAGTDGFRRRAFIAAVRPRNIGHRWNEGV
jgi:prepilin-type N-terminal cleavage/methylation domain-containing protein